ncbi:MAG: prepilin-type N-terminal cleavage/methylation domain-containing protein [Pseudomonadota bacterium]
MRRHLSQRGFTLLELVITLMILALLGAAAGYGLTGGALAFSSNADNLRTLGKLRYASERVARELREIRRSSANPAIFDITAMSGTALAFTKRDGTGVTLGIAAPLLTLAYTTPAGTYTLSDQVGSASFAYYRADGTTAATGSSDVAFVEFNLALVQDGDSYPQRTRVALRNRQ